MRRHAALALVIACAACIAAPDADNLCGDAERIATLPEPLAEASGIAASRAFAGTFWVHNDSEGSPSLYAIDAAGALVAELDLPGAGTQFDWEDIAVGPCDAGSCIYIGDIGDNYRDHDDPALLRLPAPLPFTGAAAGVERFPIRYPDGPRDAEALFVTPDTSIYIISKGRSGPVTPSR